MTKTIYFDMDGTIANLYAVENWLPKLRAEDATPYLDAKPMINFSSLARLLRGLQHKGYKIGIISWTSKGGTKKYNEEVKKAKILWLKKHLKSIIFDEINIVDYGTPKSSVVTDKNGILFDDEEQNRIEWQGIAYNVDNILNVLKELTKVA